MQPGMIGLGRMGSYMVQRLMKAGHNCVVFDTHPEAMQELVSKGAASAGTLPECEEADQALCYMADGTGSRSRFLAGLAETAARSRRHRD